MPSAFAPGWAQNVIALLCFQLERKSPALALKKPRVMAQAGGQVSPRMTRPGPPPGPSQASLFVQSAKIRSCKHTNWPWTIPGVCEKYKFFLLFVEVGFVFGDHSILFEKDSAEEERSRPGSPFIKNRSKITRHATHRGRASMPAPARRVILDLFFMKGLPGRLLSSSGESCSKRIL